MDKAAFAALTDSEHWPRIHDFNFRPLTYIQQGWFSELRVDTELVEVFSQCPDEGNQWLIDKLGLGEQWVFEFPNAVSWLALADPCHLQQIIRYCGLARWNPALRQIIWREQRDRVRQCLGDKAYEFAVNAAPLLLSQWPAHLLKKTALPQNDNELLYALDTSGLELLTALLPEKRSALATRLKLKFPACFEVYFSQGEQTRFSDDARLLQLLRKVTKVATPQCLYLLN
ncbi:Yop proteins translocation protein K [Endozoicomonas sp. Mp262]|uniref:Yop proteins translocation protein K n=1 Tax=Endozoicomonas sp. Mp262 TaxID=2919499 RepID=UPI0021D81407